MRPFILLLSAAGLSVALGALLWSGCAPLGVAGQWQWQAIDDAPTIDDFLPVLLAAPGYLLIVLAGRARIQPCRPWTVGLWLALLAAGGFGWLSAVQEAAPDGYGLEKWARVLYDPATSGYYTVARRDIDDLGEFLDHFDAFAAAGDCLHIGTHPPGLFVLHRVLLDACQASPALRDLLLRCEPAPMREMFASISFAIETQGPLPAMPAPRPADRAAIWLAALLTQLAALATIFPLYGLVRMRAGRAAAWSAVAFWPLVPAVAVFMPKSDLLLPLVAATFLWLLSPAPPNPLPPGGTVRRPHNPLPPGGEGRVSPSPNPLPPRGEGRVRGRTARRRSWLRRLAAGAVLWLGMLISLAPAVVGLIGGAWLVLSWTGLIAPDHQSWKRRLGDATALAAGFLVPTALVALFFGLDLPETWCINYRKHAAFYELPGHPRTYWKWLLWNPVETVVAVGVPLVLVALLGATRRESSGERGQNPASIPPSVVPPRSSPLVPLSAPTHRAAGNLLLWCWLAVWALLWLSGKNMGEAARLWIFLMPAFVLAVGDRLECRRAPGWFVAGMLAVQMLVGLAVIQNVHGFHQP